jgi:hypothetical protein
MYEPFHGGGYGSREKPQRGAMGHGGPEGVVQRFRRQKAWFITTWGDVQHLYIFEELDAIIKEEEVAFGPIRQPNVKGDVFVVLQIRILVLGIRTSPPFPSAYARESCLATPRTLSM